MKVSPKLLRAMSHKLGHPHVGRWNVTLLGKNTLFLS